MPYIPLSFPVPPRKATSLAPADTAEALALNLPSELPPRDDKPSVPAYKGPRRRTFKSIKITEKPVSMGQWDVSPIQIAEELGL